MRQVLFVALFVFVSSPVLADCPVGYSEVATFRAGEGTIVFHDADAGPYVELAMRDGSTLKCDLENVDDSPEKLVDRITCGNFQDEPIVFYAKDGATLSSVDFLDHTYERDCSADLGM